MRCKTTKFLARIIYPAARWRDRQLAAWMRSVAPHEFAPVRYGVGCIIVYERWIAA